MRHKKNRLLELSTGVQKKSNVIRNLLTSLVTHGELSTTSKKARVLKAEADSLFSKLLKMYETYPTEKDAKREADRLVKSILYTEDSGKKLVGELLPRWRDANAHSGFVTINKLGPRPGDSAEKMIVRIQL